MLLSQEAALRECDAQMLKLQETVDSQQAAFASRAAEVEHRKLLIAKLRRMQFGRKRVAGTVLRGLSAYGVQN